MAKINVNLNNVEGGFKTYPDGNFRVKIHESTKIKASKDPNKAANILWVASIVEGDFQGSLISWNTSLEGAALWNLKSLLEALGLKWSEDGFDTDDAVGLELIIHNKSGETYNNKPVNTIDAYIAIKQEK